MRAHSANIARLRRDGTLVHGARFGELGLLVLRLPDEPAVRAALASEGRRAPKAAAAARLRRRCSRRRGQM